MSARNTVYYSFPEKELQKLKNKMLNWLKPFSIFSYLDNNNYNHGPNRFEMIAAADAIACFQSVDHAAGDWLFGHFSYDLKNHIEEKLSSRHQEKIGFEDSFFFRPGTVTWIPFGTTELHVSTLDNNPYSVLQQILDMSAEISDLLPGTGPGPWYYRFSQEEYIHSVQQIRDHIEAGDCYEMNFCTEAFATVENLDPLSVYDQLKSLNPAPFSALYRNTNSWLMCASPERFLYREENDIISQPIKGTAGRSIDPFQDGIQKQKLYHNPKERAENVMIVDLVRNDLARSCVVGSVEVSELFGVYTFPQVHQLISTVKGKLRPDIGNQQIMEHAFPMGSMTGAPKMMVMQLTEQYERSRRGIYSGSVGYITPDGDFDFNVVIRSLLYNDATGYLSYQTGGAITFGSNPLLEWEEVRLKARAMEQIFL